MQQAHCSSIQTRTVVARAMAEKKVCTPVGALVLMYSDVSDGPLIIGPRHSVRERKVGRDS